MNKKIIVAIITTAAILYFARDVIFGVAKDELSEISVYRKATYALPDTFDPIKALSTADSVLSNLMYDGLFTVDETLTIVPSLVSSWEVSPDGKTYNLQIDSKRFFQDGKKLTIEDVVASLENLRGPNSPVKETFKRMKSVRKTSEFGVQIELESPYPPFVALLAAPTAKVSRAIEGSPYHIGTGPFQFEGFSTKDGHKVLTLRRIDKSYAAGREAKIKKLELWELSETNALELVRSGTIHDTAIYTSKKVPSGTGNVAVQTSAPSAVTWVIGINTQNPKLADKDVRRCLNANFEKELFVKKFIPHQAPAKGMLPPTLSGFGDLPDLNKISTAQCKEKIGGVSLSLEFPQELDDGQGMCEFVQKNFSQINVSVICKSVQFSALLDGIVSKKADLSLLAMTLDLPDVEYFLNTFESTATFNLSSYSSRQIDENLRLARLEQDRQKRSIYFQRINEEIYRNDVTINISYPRHISYRHTCIENFRIGLAGDAYINYDSLSLNPLCTHRENFL